MSSVVSAIKNTISLSQFNRGMAGKIFFEVKTHGSKVVMKNNNPEVVLVPPDEYLEITDALNDYLLLIIAVKRMESYDPLKVITEAEMDKRLGITQEDLDSIGKVEIE